MSREVMMRILTILKIFCISTGSWGQSIHVANSRYLTYEQNQNWLTTTKSLDKSGQWAAITKRFFFKETQNISTDSIRYSPLVVINGVPFDIPGKLTEESTDEILSLLNETSIHELTIIDKLTEQWIFCKPFAGVIIVRVDKKTYKKLAKLKLG